MTVAGTWGRWIVLLLTGNMYLFLIPHIFVAICRPFLQNGLSRMATVWFGDSQRAIATSIGCLALPMGDILGFAITPVFVSDKDPLPEVKQRVITYCLWAAVMVSVFSLPKVCFFREKP